MFWAILAATWAALLHPQAGEDVRVQCAGSELTKSLPLATVLGQLFGGILRGVLCCCRRRPRVQRVRYLFADVRLSADPLGAFLARAQPFADGTAASAPTLADVVGGMHGTLFKPLMLLLSHGAFPYPLLGSVHVASDIECAVAPQVILGAGAAAVDVIVAWSSSEDEPHAKGTEFKLQTTVVPRGTGTGTGAADGQQGAWLWRSTTRILSFHKRPRGQRPPAAQGSAASGPSSASPAAELPSVGRVDTGRDSTTLGRAWAAVSGDCNPIHMHALAARLLGFKQGIVAHGMVLVELALRHPALITAGGQDAVQPPPPTPADATASPVPLLRAHVSFVRPAFLPGAFRIHAGDAVEDTTAVRQPAARRQRFGIVSSATGKASVEGWVEVAVATLHAS